jgi:plasmid stabilization system protein ParE
VKVGFHPAAEAELRRAARYYEDRALGLGGEFVVEVERVCARLKEHQELGPKLDAQHRRIALRRFPFGLIYRVKNSVVQIVAVAHRRRRPGYWMQFIGE